MFRLRCPTLLFQHNVEAMIWKRHYEVQSNPIKKAYLYASGERCAPTSAGCAAVLTRS